MAQDPIKGALYNKVGNDLVKMYPETSADQVKTADGASVEDRLPSAAQKALLNKTVNMPGGILVADAGGYLPNDRINPSLFNQLLTDYDKPNYAGMLAVTGMDKGDTCFVEDNSGAPSASAGWAVYRYTGTAWSMLISQAGTGLTIDISGKADKRVPSASGNLAGLDASGNLIDLGVDLGSLNKATTMVVDDLDNVPDDLPEGSMVFFMG